MKEETKQNIKNKIKDTKTKVKESGRKTLRWIDHNKEFVLMAGATVIGAGVKLAQARNKQRELDLRTNTIYDPSTGQRYRTRRAMSSSEQLEFEYRKKAGEPTGVILDDMNLLK
mgnify:CR=1 FL=1